MPAPVIATALASAIAKGAPAIAAAAKGAPGIAAALKYGPALATMASQAGLQRLASLAEELGKKGAFSKMDPNAVRNMVSAASQRIRDNLAGLELGKSGDLGKTGADATRKLVSAAVQRMKSNLAALELDKIISANGLPYLGMGNSKRFIDKATYFFLSQYLPQILSQGGLNGTSIGQLLLPAGGAGGAAAGSSPTFSAFADPNDPDSVSVSNYLPPSLPDKPNPYIPFTLGEGGPTVSGPFGNGPSGSGTGGELARMFGYGGQPGGGWSVEDLLNGAGWSGQVEPAEQSDVDPFAERDAEMEWRRKQQKKQAKFERKLQEKNQEWIDERMRKYYKKPWKQWMKEKLPEAAGVGLQTIGQSMNAYNSILANALMQSAASSLSKRQEEMYGNPLASGTAMIAGGHMARGRIADAIGQNVGGLLQDWAKDIAGEFERLRGYRLQMDINPSGLSMDALYKIGRYPWKSTRNLGRRDSHV